MFEMIDRDGLARIGRLEVHGRSLETPALLPVINPKAGPITPRELRERFGFGAIITNSFIIGRDEGLRKRALAEGLHRMLDYDGLIMTDSGTFQEYTYGDTQVDPLAIVDFQREIGSDIGTILDVFSEPDFSRARATSAVEKTIERAREAAMRKGDMWLSGPIQGSLFWDLRTRCAEEMSALDLDIHPIGGVVPLMEGYRFSELVDVIVSSKKGLDPSRPVHLFGAGHPMLFPIAALLGCDMFDSASYAKYARDGRMMFSDGTLSIDGITELWCHCPVCSRHTADELRAIPQGEREKLIAEHNLHECQAQIRRTKEAIRDGSIWDLVEKTCRSHTRLLDALRALRKHNEFLEEYEPLSRQGALMCTGSESLHRPAVWRYQKRFFERYVQPDVEVMVALPEAEKPYSRTYANLLDKINAHFIVLSSIGPVPMELDEIYPAGHIFPPEAVDMGTRGETDELWERFSHEHKYGLAVVWEGEETTDLISKIGPPSSEPIDLDRIRIASVLRMQFGREASCIVEGAELSYVKSKNTGRIRNVIISGVHALSIRATDGYFSLTDEGARLLHSALPYPGYRVKVETDAVPFIRKGSNAFSKFVLDADPSLRPGDEAMIVDPSDALVGHGRCLMNRREMLAFKRGVAVKTRSRGGDKEQED
jgi:7-cyano-7-deazaguanine tRNA-ribosyltransferase